VKFGPGIADTLCLPTMMPKDFMTRIVVKFDSQSQSHKSQAAIQADQPEGAGCWRYHFITFRI
jgi:hypothetical protein